MLILRIAVCIISVGLMNLVSSEVAGQNFPSRPIRIVTTTIGGSGDFASRLIAEAISGPLGQPVIVENRLTIVIPDLVKNAAPDGYTVLYNGSGFMFRPLFQKVSYDPIKDYSPITVTAKGPMVLVVHPTLPVKSVKELIALAKSKPGQLNHGTINPGGGLHLAMELFKSMAGVNVTPILYKSNGVALNGLLVGEVQLLFGDVLATAPHIKADRVRAVAITSPEPSILYPGLPTVSTSGLPGYDMVGIDGIWAPVKTPTAVINRLNQEIVRALNNPDIKQKFLNTGVEAIGSSPEQLASTMKREIDRTAKLIKDAGIPVEK